MARNKGRMQIINVSFKAQIAKDDCHKMDDDECMREGYLALLLRLNEKKKTYASGQW